MAWAEEKPFGDAAVDGDAPEHIMWIMNKAKSRADAHDIDASAIDFRKTQGVTKRIIPAVASTNAVIGRFRNVHPLLTLFLHHQRRNA